MKQIVIAVLIATSAAAVHAQRAAPAGGAGRDNCSQYQQDRPKEFRPKGGVYTAWVLGLLSGYNIYASQPQVTPLPAPATIVAYLDKYCQDHPLDTVMQATGALIADMGGYRPPYLKK